MGEPGIMITPMNLPFVNADGTDEGDDFAGWVVRITTSGKLFVHILRIFYLSDWISGVKSAPRDG